MTNQHPPTATQMTNQHPPTATQMTNQHPQLRTDAMIHESNSFEESIATMLSGWESYAESIATMLRGWESYAATHEASYGAEISKDFVLGPAWAEIGLAIKRLLDGDCGGLDCGSVERNILTGLDAQGFKHDGFTITNE